MNNKALIIALVLALIFITGCDASALKLKQLNHPSNTLMFKDLSYVRTSDGFMIQGKLTSSTGNDTDGILLKLFCKNINVGNITTDSNGLFAIKNFCKAGDEAYIQAIHNGTVFESKHRILTHGFFQGIIQHMPENNRVSGVPEFSIITIALAIMATTLGLAYLRKS